MIGSGIAAHEAAPAAVAAYLHCPSDPVAAISFAVAMGGDTDTVAAMAGSLAGAASGEGSLPERLLRRLEQRERLTHVADALADRTYSWRIT
ncbi:MAG TPA: ADP-ribosylglycohydrolase family protein [Jiangellaceae bacterium]